MWSYNEETVCRFHCVSWNRGTVSQVFFPRQKCVVWFTLTVSVGRFCIFELTNPVNPVGSTRVSLPYLIDFLVCGFNQPLMFFMYVKRCVTSIQTHILYTHYSSFRLYLCMYLFIGMIKAVTSGWGCVCVSVRACVCVRTREGTSVSCECVYQTYSSVYIMLKH